MSKALGCENLLKIVKDTLTQIPEKTTRKKQITLIDCLMSAYAMFSLKYPSLLQFDKHAKNESKQHNIKSVYLIKDIPSDTQLRERLDELNPKDLRGVFRKLFSVCQRSKKLELFKFYNERYLFPLDGTGYFSSNKIHCKNCCKKEHRDGSTSYYHQMLSGAIVHPDLKVVLPFAPEPIMKTDGAVKNDCERNSAKRFLADLQKEHPHLKLIVTGDGLFSNGPFIKLLKSYGHNFILVAKESDHKALFEEFRLLPKETHQIKTIEKNKEITHEFSFIKNLSINDSHSDCTVNVLEYWEKYPSGRTKHWVWVTDIEPTKDNVFEIMRGGRARYKIENETFNTLKNQGYQFEHNFGHGYKNLSTNFALIMFTAFFVDQLQQLGCKLFSKALNRHYCKRDLWEHKRSIFFTLLVDNIKELWSGLAYGFKVSKILIDTS